jgi:hypothetical protein
MHWGWKNCPKVLAGKFKGKEKGPTSVLEVVATHNTWIWHSFFGTSGSLNVEILSLPCLPHFSFLNLPESD